MTETRYKMMCSMEKAWKEDVLYFIRKSFDPSQDDDANYERIINDYDEYKEGFIEDYFLLSEEELKELGGDEDLCVLLETYEDLSNDEQCDFDGEVHKLVLEYSEMLMSEEEEWIRRKVRKMRKV